MRQVNNIDHIIAKNIYIMRMAYQHSLKDVASQIGISYQQLRKYETCVNRISASKLYELSVIYKTPIHHFYEEQS